MNLNRRQLLGTGATLAATALLAACSGGETTTAPPVSGGQPKQGGTLRIGALGRTSAITRDPHGTQGNESDYLILALIYDTLTVPGAEENIAGRLAESWKPSDDLKTWRFSIVKNAVFHDGTPVTAEDVVWSLRWLRATPSGAARLPGIQAKNITADGPSTVVLTSDYPNTELPLLTRLTTFVLKKDTADDALGPVLRIMRASPERR